jgi:hypothetical protein
MTPAELHRARDELIDLLHETLATRLNQLEMGGTTLAEIGSAIGRGELETTVLMAHPERWTLSDLSDL